MVDVGQRRPKCFIPLSSERSPTLISRIYGARPVVRVPSAPPAASRMSQQPLQDAPQRPAPTLLRGLRAPGPRHDGRYRCGTAHAGALLPWTRDAPRRTEAGQGSLTSLGRPTPATGPGWPRSPVDAGASLPSGHGSNRFAIRPQGARRSRVRSCGLVRRGRTVPRQLGPHGRGRRPWRLQRAAVKAAVRVETLQLDGSSGGEHSYRPGVDLVAGVSPHPVTDHGSKSRWLGCRS